MHGQQSRGILVYQYMSELPSLDRKVIVPVLPTDDLDRDIAWYEEKVGFSTVWHDHRYAILRREMFEIHLQLHPEDRLGPLLYGSTIRIRVADVIPYTSEFMEASIITASGYTSKTAWGTAEVVVQDPNGNVIYFVQKLG